MTRFPFVWRVRKWRPDRTGQRCRIIRYGRGPGPRNWLVEFEDGERVVGARYCARPAKPGEGSQRELFG